jgi:S-DNA-T family DNA segregation ATPase FtsK/SpoIIIE
MTKSTGQNKKSSRRSSAKKQSSDSGFFRFIFSPGFWIAILVIAAAVLIYWFLPDIIYWWEGFWHDATQLFGLGLLLLLILLITIIVLFARGKGKVFITYWYRCIGILILTAFVWGIFSLIDTVLGGEIGLSITSQYTVIGILRLIGILILALIFIFPGPAWHALSAIGRGFIALIDKLFVRTPTDHGRDINKQEEPVRVEHITTESISYIPETVPAQEIVSESTITESTPAESLDLSLYESAVTVGGWQLPPVNILDKPVEIEVTQADVDKRAEILEHALSSYGVDAAVVGKHVGPTVTQYEVEPGWDKKYKELKEKDKDGNITVRQQEISKTRVKVERISSLANDLALALAAPSIRIEAPIPGKSVIGVEVPNNTFGSVNLRSIIESTTYQKTLAKSKLAIPLGKGAGGEVAAADLSKMPHLLVAGATGSGKTVYLNSIVCCLLFCNTPDDLKFIMVDPKRVELVNYNNLPHLAAPVVVDTEKAVLALKWLVGEMDNRYRMFSQAGARNIETYNKNRGPGDALPFIVLVIDELADLMMTAFGEVEHSLCRLAQLARATGIHLIVATQRPSVDVITGLIKANFPTRISFSLTSQIDSRTILDSTGAEKLLGRGDMLYMPTDASKPKRLQGPFLSDAEIDRLVQFWANQSKIEQQTIRFEDVEQKSISEGGDDDTLLEAARQLATEHEGISTSFLQRKLKIGYPRAARIMETLKEEGF